MNHDGYYFNPKIVGFSAGFSFACLDGYQTDLSAPAQPSPNGLLLPGKDLVRFIRMYSPEICCADIIPYQLYSVQAVLESIGCRFAEKGRTLQLLLTPETVPADEDAVLAALNQCKNKPGDYRGAYWHTTMQRFAPYRVYLPQSCQGKAQNKLLIGLHGGGGSPDSIFQNSNGKIKYYAERDAFILLAPDACTLNSTYGCAIPPNGMVGAHWDRSHPENPEGLCEADLRSVQMGSLGLDQIIAIAQSDYSIDPNQLFLMGNSMGGMGTLYYAAQHPGMFHKICAQGAIPNMEFFDCNPLRSQTTLFVAGEKDSHGIEFLRQGVFAMKSAGVPVIYREVPNGTHSSSWVDVLDEIFVFFRP